MMSQLIPYLQLCRLPTVFTAMADIFLGYLLVHDGIITGNGRTGDFLLLLAASCSLYLAGMVWNDVFDRRVDAGERPNRPLPSGRVPLRNAVLMGTGLLVLGLLCAAIPAFSPVESVTGERTASIYVALMLVICIIAYDALLKRPGFGLLGPLAMGCCRGLNVMLGASTVAGGFVEHFLSTPLVLVPVGLAIYIAGVTWFARTEARVSSRWQLAGAMLVVNLGLATLIAWIVNFPGKSRQAVLLAMAIIVLTINRRLAAAVAQPLPERVQPAIRTMLLSLIVLDATLIAHRLGPEGAGYAVVTVLLLIPAMFLGRWLRMT